MADVDPKAPQRVVVEIFGESYPLRTDDPARLKKLAGSVKSFDGTKIAVLTALQLADEYDKLKQDYDELVELLDEK